MKTSNKLRYLALIVLVLGVGLVYATTQKTTSATASSRYHFTGESAGEVSLSDHWQQITGSDPSSCDNAEELPCVVDLSGSEYSDIEAFLTEKQSLQSIMESDELISSKSE